MGIELTSEAWMGEGYWRYCVAELGEIIRR
jgi:hypothetical protein